MPITSDHAPVANATDSSQEPMEIWLTVVTDDETNDEPKPLTAGNRIECREGCGW
jgi:hypothetical protein